VHELVINSENQIANFAYIYKKSERHDSTRKDVKLSKHRFTTRIQNFVLSSTEFQRLPR